MRIFFSEWRKLRRPAFFFGTMGSVVFVTGLVTSLLFLLIDAKTGNADRGNRITREMLELSDGFTIGEYIDKDMTGTYNYEIPAEYAPLNVYAPYGLSECMKWRDWGGDIFDQWGYFYLFDIESQEYYLWKCYQRLSESSSVIVGFGR